MRGLLQHRGLNEDSIARSPTRPVASGLAVNLLISAKIIADTMEEMGLKLPPTHVDIAAIRRKFHAAEREEKVGGKRDKLMPTIG